MRRRFPTGVLVAIAAGGAAGTLLRALVAQAIPPPAAGFPWATFAVNAAGSLIVGFVVVTSIERIAPTRYLRPLLATGFCGGLTTFSTFADETVLLIRAGRAGVAAAYVAASLVGGLGAAWAGTVLARVAWRRQVA
jgi:fluoride exporter